MYLQEPVERRLGQNSQRFVKENNSCIKQTWDLVYDVPLISSIQQLLSNEHILDEVWCICILYICVFTYYVGLCDNGKVIS